MTEMFIDPVRAFTTAALVAIATAPLAAGAETTRVAFAPRAPQAPMDRYFGKLAMSPLGVENAIALASVRAGAYNATATTVTRSLVFVEDSVKDWESKFPKDRWLPPTRDVIREAALAKLIPARPA